MSESCEGCRYFVARKTMRSAYDGLCRRVPPVVVAAGSGASPGTFFPQVDADGWCGEFVAREDRFAPSLLDRLNMENK